MNDVIVSMKDICKTFPGVKALDNVQFELCSGEVMALLGENGAGKSTLMKILSGVYTRDSGELEIFGKSYDAIIVAANGPDAISSALKEAQSKGVKIVYVDSPANVDAEATFSTDNFAAGTTAGQTMIDALKAAGVESGSIGIISVNNATASTVSRDEGFRKAFEGTGYTLLETQFCEGDAAKAQTIAENYITEGVVGVYGCNEGSTTGAGNAIKASGKDIVGVGFDKSDAIMGLINDGYLLATMAQNPDVMGYEGVKAAVDALNGNSLGGAVTDTGVSVLTK